jgi:hypothetical protein
MSVRLVRAIKLFLSLAVFIGLPEWALSSGSGIGNGGDPLFYFLEATRDAYVETVKAILSDQKEQNKFCQKSTLSSEKVQLCRDFFLAIAEQILTLNQGAGKTLFVLKEEPILVNGPDGKPMQVEARTELGPSGFIEFHHNSLKLMAPKQALFLLAHEFGHKSHFLGRYLTDNERAEPFANGRELLDTVATAVVEAARRQRKIGSEFGLRDHFECLAVLNGGQASGGNFSAARLFLSEDLLAYQTSFNRNPRDDGPWVPEGNSENPGAKLVFRVIISEPVNCSSFLTIAELSSRRTELTIVRQTKANGSEPAKEVVLETLSLDGVNPMCEKQPRDLTLSTKHVKFTCRYFGTEGSTSLQRLPGSEARRLIENKNGLLFKEPRFLK